MTMSYASTALLRYLREAEPYGLSTTTIQSLFPELSTKKIECKLSYLKAQGYMLYYGRTRRGVWRIGPRTPEDRAEERSASRIADRNRRWPHCSKASTLDVHRTKVNPIRGVPPGVPNSVWAYAQQVALCA